MATRSIPRQEWTAFCDNFSREHLGQTATLEMIGQDLGDQPVAEEPQVFRGISADEKDRENRIEIMVGPNITEGPTHSVSSPIELWLTENEGAISTSLEIRDADGTAAVLTFVAPELPTVV
ncbi:MAG TPA: DUF5335 family protein [Chloroflexota bacterium]|nr:DUF5335 family protein [Chloroflexota bacterium]